MHGQRSENDIEPGSDSKGSRLTIRASLAAMLVVLVIAALIRML